MRKKLLFVFAILLLTSSVITAKENIIVWGGNLSASQKEIVRSEFEKAGARLDGAQEMIVSNQEERAALAGKVDLSAIGTRAISSVYIELGSGRGVNVKTRNISLITSQMYKSALVTGGIEQAKVIAAAPTAVSGTAALTGIFKAYEELSGEELSEEAKDAATAELVQAGELGQEIGQENATKLMEQIKTQVLKQKPQTREQVEKIIQDAASKMNVNLSSRQMGDLSILFLRIGKLPLDFSQVKALLSSGGFWGKFTAFFSQLGQLFAGLWQQLMTLVA